MQQVNTTPSGAYGRPPFIIYAVASALLQAHTPSRQSARVPATRLHARARTLAIGGAITVAEQEELMAVDVGNVAPDFALSDQNGALHHLRDYRGRWVVLYFYPKDDTAGCTKEAQSFRDNFAEITGKNAVVIGISADSVGSHRSFAEKYSLPFILLADPDRTAIETYGVWREKNLYGKTSMGIERSTFLINPEGTIERVWRKVQVDGHTEQVVCEIA